MKCKCELAFTVKKLNPACEIHNESDVYSNLVERLSEEREKILAALGEHPDSPVDIPQRIAAIRDEGRAHFHTLTRIQEREVRLNPYLKDYPDDPRQSHGETNEEDV